MHGDGGLALRAVAGGGCWGREILISKEGPAVVSEEAARAIWSVNQLPWE